MKYRKRKVGAQPGNRNARKHGFYSTVVTSGRQDDLPADAVVEEMEHDIAIARYKLKSLLEKDPGNIRLVAYLISLQDRLVRTRCLVLDHRLRTVRQVSDALGEALSITPETTQPQGESC